MAQVRSRYGGVGSLDAVGLDAKISCGITWESGLSMGMLSVYNASVVGNLPKEHKGRWEKSAFSVE